MSPPKRAPWRMAYQLKDEARAAKQKDAMSPMVVWGVPAERWTAR